MNHRKFVRVSKDYIFGRSLRIFMGMAFDDGSHHLYQATNLLKVESYLEPSPTFTIDIDEAQKLIDELWHCGLRPSEGSGSAGQLASTQRHLEDMRTVAFKKLGINPIPAKVPL